jgi:hypothetical protein
MIASLADAWRWYESVKDLTLAMRQLGKKHWDTLPWDSDLGRDNRLRYLKAPQIVERSAMVLDDLDDLCISLLFSVFESHVRERVMADVAQELPPLRHAALKDAVEAMNEALEHGSFFKVLNPFKPKLGTELVEQVHQVRKYRNWVAHGRRGQPENAVDPRTAYERLQLFLDRLTEVAADTAEPTPT